MGRNWAVISALCVCSLATQVNAETADELIAKNLEARGGAAAMSSIQSLVTKGELRAPGDFRLAFSETRSRLQTGSEAFAVRVEATIQGLTLIQAYDGKNAWRVNPFQGRKDPEQMGSDDARALADDASIDGALLAARASGSKVEFLGREDVEGTDAYKLRVTQADGDIYTYFLDPDVYLEIKVVELRTIRGAEKETETDLGDYEKVAGVYFPFLIVSGPKNSPDKQAITIKSAEANVSVSPVMFEMPTIKSAQSK